MKELIRFSLKRRFLNKTFLVSQILLVIMIAGLLNIDKLASAFGLSTSGFMAVDYLSDTSGIDKNLAGKFGFVLSDKAKVKITETKEGFKVDGFQTSDQIGRLRLQTFLTLIHQNEFLSEHSPSVAELIAQYSSIAIEFAGEEIAKPIGRESIVFMILTAVYFLVLNFVAMTSNEVVSEKASNVLDMILSATDVKSHYRSKLLGGWLTLGLQGGFALGILGFFTYLRNQQDLGKGLLIWASQFGLVDRETISFRILLEKMDLSLSFGITILFCVFFLFCGMALIQVLLMVVATNLKSAEEASILQGPVYIFLLVLYYVALSQNNAPQLTRGFGYIASFIPLGSMLFMPMRLLLMKVAFNEIVFSGFIAIAALGSMMAIGQRIYGSHLRQKRQKMSILRKEK
jgi:ABC-2 type transport system permease protein